MRTAALSLLLALPLAGCEPTAPVYDYGIYLDDVEFSLFDTEMGVYPNTAILADPANPFAADGVGVETKWDILSAGYWPATFYAWGTLTAQQPNGEHQYYTAVAAHEMYQRADVETQDLYYVWRIAIGGYQAVLDHFPDAVTYDATGTVAYPLAPIAYTSIEALGGRPEGWTLVTGDDGTQTVIPVTTAPEEE